MTEEEMIRAELARRKRDTEVEAIRAELARRKIATHLKSVYPDDWERRMKVLEDTVFNNEWIPSKYRTGLTLKQAEFLVYDGRECLYGGSAGGGKALCVNTPVPTPAGWTTMGKLKVGDSVLAPDGTTSRVIWTSGILQNRPCYRLTFDDHTEVIADEQHLWHTFTADDLMKLFRRSDGFRAKRRGQRPSRVGGKKTAKFTESIRLRNSTINRPDTLPPPTGGVRTTKDVFDTLKVRNGTRTNHCIANTSPVELPPADLPLDPYLLGVWLGDGTAITGGVTSADLEIPQAFCAAGFTVVKVKQKYLWSVHGLVPKLRSLGVLGDKHVPATYLRGSAAQRLSLLQGLMDTDGTANKSGSVEFCNTNRRLSEAVYELAASLGHKPHIREGLAKLNGRVIGPKWTVKWMAPEPVFRLARKLSRQKITAIRPNTKYRYIVGCEPIESVPVCCITVDRDDGMFLVGRNFLPTHNSIAALMGAAQYVNNPNYHALILRRTYKQLAKAESILSVSKEWWHGKAKWNGDTYTWTFPSGATVEFGHMDGPNDHLNYQGAVFQFVCYDELTQWGEEQQYTFLFTRQRRPLGSELPIRMRATSNPGGPGHEWVKKRFIDTKTKRDDAHFIPAKLDDNPNLDRADYIASMGQVDPITRDQMLGGNWDAIKGGRFLKEWFRYYRHDDEGFVLLYDKSGNVIERFLPWSRPRWQTYDPSAGKSEDSDHFVVSTWCLSPLSNLVWLDCHRDRQEIPDQLAVAQRLYRRWQPQFMAVEEVLNQKAHAQILRRSTDPVMNIHSVSPLGKSKLERATPSLVFAASGRLYLPEDNRAFPLDDVEGELVRFTGEDGNPDDICDTFFYSNQCLTLVSPYANSSSADLIPAVRERTAIPGREEARRKHLFGRGGNAPGVVRPKW